MPLTKTTKGLTRDQLIWPWQVTALPVWEDAWMWTNADVRGREGEEKVNSAGTSETWRSRVVGGPKGKTFKVLMIKVIVGVVGARTERGKARSSGSKGSKLIAMFMVDAIVRVIKQVGATSSVRTE